MKKKKSVLLNHFFNCLCEDRGGTWKIWDVKGRSGARGSKAFTKRQRIWTHEAWLDMEESGVADSGKWEESKQGSSDEVEELCHQNAWASELEGEGGSGQRLGRLTQGSRNCRVGLGWGEWRSENSEFQVSAASFVGSLEFLWMLSGVGEVTVDSGPDYESSVKVRTLLRGQGKTQAEERGQAVQTGGKVLCKRKVIMFWKWHWRAKRCMPRKDERAWFEKKIRRKSILKEI